MTWLDRLRNGHISLWCRFWRHGEGLRHVDARGLVWRCPSCGRQERSVLRHLRPGHVK